MSATLYSKVSASGYIRIRLLTSTRDSYTLELPRPDLLDSSPLLHPSWWEICSTFVSPADGISSRNHTVLKRIPLVTFKFPPIGTGVPRHSGL